MRTISVLLESIQLPAGILQSQVIKDPESNPGVTAFSPGATNIDPAARWDFVPVYRLELPHGLVSGLSPYNPRVSMGRLYIRCSALLIRVRESIRNKTNESFAHLPPHGKKRFILQTGGAI